MIIRPVEAETLGRTDGQTQTKWHDEANSRLAKFCEHP